jgi:hypothetical protein
MKWLTTQVFGLPKGLWLLVVIAALLGAGLLWQHSQRVHDTQQREIGKTEERAAETTTVLQRTEQGNEAREAIKQAGPVGDRLRYDQCVRSARTPANCQRFLPQRPAP